MALSTHNPPELLTQLFVWFAVLPDCRSYASKIFPRAVVSKCLNRSESYGTDPQNCIIPEDPASLSAWDLQSESRSKQPLEPVELTWRELILHLLAFNELLLVPPLM